MSDLVTWLRAELDEDERVAREAAEALRCGCHPGSYPGAWTAYDTHVRTELHDVAGGEGWPAAIDVPVAQHIARWDPARVLAEIDAKRRLLIVVLAYEATIDGEWGCCHEADQIAAGRCPVTSPDEIHAVRIMALPYADRPGYQDFWRP